MTICFKLLVTQSCITTLVFKHDPVVEKHFIKQAFKIWGGQCMPAWKKLYLNKIYDIVKMYTTGRNYNYVLFNESKCIT